MFFKKGIKVTSHRIRRGPDKGKFFPGTRVTGIVVADRGDFVLLKDVKGYKLKPDEKPEFWKDPFTRVSGA